MTSCPLEFLFCKFFLCYEIIVSYKKNPKVFFTLFVIPVMAFNVLKASLALLIFFLEAQHLGTTEEL